MSLAGAQTIGDVIDPIERSAGSAVEPSSGAAVSLTIGEGSEFEVGFNDDYTGLAVVDRSEGSDRFDDLVTLGEAYDGLRDAALKVTATDPIEFPETSADSYGGVLKLTIDQVSDDGPNQIALAVPFYIPPIPAPNQPRDAAGENVNGNAVGDVDESEANHDLDPYHLRARAIAMQLDLSMLAVQAAAQLRAAVGASGSFGLSQLRYAIDALEPSRIDVGSSGDRLTFTLTDGVARRLSVSAGQPSDLTTQLGLTDDDVALIMKVLAGVPGLGVDRNASVDELIDSAAAVQRLGLPDDADAHSAYVVRPDLSGAGELNLPIDVQLETNPVAGLGQPEEFLESYLQPLQGGDGGAVWFSLDRSGEGLAVRLDLELEVAQQHVSAVQLPVDVDMSQLRVGDRISLRGQTGGIDGSDTFSIAAVDAQAHTVRLDGALYSRLIPTVGDLTDITSLSLDVDGGLEAAINLLRGDFNLAAMASGWEGAWNLLGQAMQRQVFSLNIPLIGDALREQADFIDRING